ncbi:uncharacterized protein K441DRAFT_284274 [Cenococcum geophilum 1.58]|uniref:uncharacterized protein n=1 Tax=Cenococcum geophilum 1.58 TaxID=794803 RepID=UPI00358EE83E|nr:hypothetical protein K441DRAFT_284274 [Cenococcum geophilum 1.58]
MGVTGAGKSTFISHCSDDTIEIGRNLNGCKFSQAEPSYYTLTESLGTNTVSVYACNFSPTQTVYLIDTPGFDDTNRSDTEVLREVASWLTASYSNKIRLSGIIYFHRISDLRMQGSAKKNLFLFQKLCGSEALKNVVLATTMWDRVNFDEGLGREKQLVETQEFWGWMMKQGSRIFRHSNDHLSARRLIDIFLAKPTTITLELQNQMVNKHLSLEQTDAGITLEVELLKERKRWERRLREAQEEMKEALESRNQDAIAAIQEVQRDYKSRMDLLEKDRHDLKINMEKLHHEKYAELEAKLKTQEEALRAQQESYDIELQRLRTEKKEHQEDLEAAERREKLVLAALERLRVGSEKQRPKPSKHGRPVSLALRADRIFLCSDSRTHWGVNSGLEAKAERESWYKSETVAFGGNESYVASYRNIDQRKRWTCGASFDKQYPDLYKILHDGGWNKLDFISFGPKRRYFMRFHGGETRDNLPSRLLKRILKSRSRGDVKILALGRDKSFVVVFRDGKYHWDLDRKYKDLEDKLLTLEECGTGIEAIALDCKSLEKYLLFAEDRILDWDVSPSQVSSVRRWEAEAF